MKKFILLFTLMFSSISFGQTWTNKPVPCTETERLIKDIIIKKYKETAVWLGENAEKNNFALFVNVDSGGWTLIEFKGKTACILGAGNSSSLSEEIKQ